MLTSNFNRANDTEIVIDRVTTKKKFKNYKVLTLFSFLISFILVLFIINTKHLENVNLKLNFLKKIFIEIGFELKNIEIYGTNNIPNKDILKITNYYKNINIFDVSLIELHQKLSKIGWVEKIHIKRILPDTIQIKVKEKEAIAIWQNEFENKLITDRGDVIATADIYNFRNILPIINGNNANKKVNSILKVLKSNDNFSKNIWSLTFVNNRRWNLHFNQGIVVLLPAKGIHEAWRKLLILHHKYDILNLGLTELDFRNPNHILGKINFDKNLIKDRKSL